MLSKYPGVTRFQFRKDVALVDIPKNLPESAYPGEIPYPYLIDNIYEQDASKRNVTLLTDMAGIILSFIAMGVDIEKHLPDIVMSEYEGISLDSVTEAINKIIRLLEELDYLEPRKQTLITNLPKDLEGFQITRRPVNPDLVESLWGKTFVTKFPPPVT